LEKISSESNTYLGGKHRDTITQYRCTVCDTKWEHETESGAGGHGNFWTKQSDE